MCVQTQMQACTAAAASDGICTMRGMPSLNWIIYAWADLLCLYRRM